MLYVTNERNNQIVVDLAVAEGRMVKFKQLFVCFTQFFARRLLIFDFIGCSSILFEVRSKKRG